ncbi:aminopeptidase N [Pararhizobium sp. IMCC21322]|uniref:aminopeptidase N n=1 Tax=Pararhizobium sp. IMCC21322 TaxID=3067903 RepID=UPI002740E618|nr:aminopeptidase N [Pararhizobium sp. IMCC21322]
MTPQNRRKKATYLSDYEPTPFAIDHTDLRFALGSEVTDVTAELTMRRRADAAQNARLEFDGDELVLVSLEIDGKPLAEKDYSATPDKLTIYDLPASGDFKLTIGTRVNPKANKQLMGLYRSGSAYCTQCEAEGFRRITYFYDRPDVLSTFTVRIEADAHEAPFMLSNGNMLEQGVLDAADMPSGAKRHYAVWHDPFPKPSYLFALVAGDLACVEDSFTTQSGRAVKLQIFVEHGNEGKCDYAMDALKRSMRWDEERFGREYDLDIFMIVAVSDFNMGAMENKGLNVFNDKYVLTDPETATDVDYYGVERVIAHEYFHNWTGNRITCREWFQLCLKEGLTVYRDQEFSADMRSAPVQRIGDVRSLIARQFPEDQGPLAHPVRPDVYEEIDNFYTATIYNKGAELVRMLATILGQDGFRKGMDLYFERHDGDATTIEAFLACFQEANETDLTNFSHWYHQPGTPVVNVDEIKHDDGSRLLTVSQRFSELPHFTEDRPALTIPLVFGYVGPDGQDVPVAGSNGETDMMLLTEQAQDFKFDNVPSDARLSVNRNFSAPIVLEQNQEPEDQVFIAEFDTDPFNRWQAVQNLAMNSLTATNAAILAREKPEPPLPLVTALRSVLANDALDSSFKAQCFQLPSHQAVAEAVGAGFDPDAIANAKAYINAYVALGLEQEMTTFYEKALTPNDTTTDAANAARRALMNAVLKLLVASDKPEHAALAVTQTMSAKNMTDRMGALSALCLQGRTERAEPLVAMYEQFDSNGLVMDKWLGLQAVTNSDETLDTVRALLHDPVFSMENPNRVRSLIGGFASNFQQFNRMDGSGYQFLARQVGALDEQNPQIAARLLEGLRSWRNLEPLRRNFARLALEKLRDQSGLSSNVSDITNRLLGDS